MAREEEEPNLVLCLRIPDEEDGLEANHLQIRKEDEEEGGEEGEEEITVRKGAKRKRGGTSATCARRCFDIHPVWPDTCVRIRTRNRMNAMFAGSVLVNPVL